MVDYFVKDKGHDGVIVKVKPITDALYDVEVDITGGKPLKTTWPNAELFFCGEK